METFIIITKEETDKSLKTSFLCSKKIFLNDKIFFESENNPVIQEGIVEKIDNDNQLVTLINNQRTFLADYNNCFFPIIELFNNGDISHKQEINRDELYFSNICPKCKNNSRELENCKHSKDECSKQNKKPYAFIKI
jgi:hypothetical protein